MSVVGAITRLQAIAGGLSGVKEAPTYPPEAANQFPFSVSYVPPSAGSWHVESAGFSHLLVTLVTEIHVARTNLPKDMATALPYGELFLQALLNDQTLSGAVDTIAAVGVEYGRMEWGGVETIGWRFTLADTKLLINSS